MIESILVFIICYCGIAIINFWVQAIREGMEFEGSCLVFSLMFCLSVTLFYYLFRR